MEAAPIHWWPAIVALAFGVVAGVLLVTGLPPRTGSRTSLSRQDREDDEHELSATLASLADLQERRSSLEPRFYEEETRRLEAHAVELLKRTRVPLAAEPAPAAKVDRAGVVGVFDRHPLWRQAFWSLFAVLVVAALWLNLETNAERAGGTVQNPLAAAPPGEGVDDAELAELKGRLERDPNDVGALLRVAHLALRAQQFDQAEVFNQRAMALAPSSLEGRVHQAMLAAKDGHADQALSELHHITEEDPGMAEAWFFRGMLGMQSGDMTAMRQAFAQFIAVAPDGPQKERVRAMLERSKT